MKIFISHSSKDKTFVRRLANDLKTYRLPVWFDEWELKVGDSLMRKISDGLSESGWLVVVLSIDSVKSSWVQNELSVALSIELEKNEGFIIPIIIDDCNIPLLLKDKVLADFRDDYDIGFKQLLERFRVNQYGSQMLEFPEKIRLKKNKKTTLNFRYNLLVKS